MKKTKPKILLLSGIIALFGCISNKETYVPKFSINAESYIRFRITNCNEPLNFIIVYNSVFPSEQKLWNMFFDHDTTSLVKLDINHPGSVYINNQSIDCRIYVLPYDTFDIWLNMDSTIYFPENIKYGGKTASISNYLTRAKLNTFLDPSEDESVSEFNKSVDLLTQKAILDLKLFDKKEPLPDWFIELEKTDIIYSGARDKIKQFGFRYSAYRQFIPRPSDFIEQLGVKINNPDAILSESYNSLLCNFRSEKFDTLLQPPNNSIDVFYSYMYENFNYTSEYLSQESQEFFISRRISVLLDNGFYQKGGIENRNLYHQTVDSLLNYARTNFKDTSLLNTLLDYQQEQLKIIEKMSLLEKGVDGPGFKLQDQNGTFINLSDFKGQLVCLNFWSSTCSACITSIPKKNQLYDKYSKNSVAFINVYLDTEKVKWQSLIKENNYEGVHLICKGNWTNHFYQSYFIYRIPHYVLIDKEGKIIKNKVPNLSELEELIKMNL